MTKLERTITKDLWVYGDTRFYVRRVGINWWNVFQRDSAVDIDFGNFTSTEFAVKAIRRELGEES